MDGPTTQTADVAKLHLSMWLCPYPRGLYSDFKNCGHPWQLSITPPTSWKNKRSFGEIDITFSKTRDTSFDRVTIPSGKHPGDSKWTPSLIAFRGQYNSVGRSFLAHFRYSLLILVRSERCSSRCHTRRKRWKGRVHQTGGLQNSSSRSQDSFASRIGRESQDGRNHCVPILAVFSDDWDPWYQYIVMPVLRPFNEPNFTSLGEVVDFVNQTSGGLCTSLLMSLTEYRCPGPRVYARTKCGTSVGKFTIPGCALMTKSVVIVLLKIF
jgi:hypothetical protein